MCWRYLLLLALALTGCKTAQPKMDPFLGPTTVPPPGTAFNSPAATDPYYSNSGNSNIPPYVPQGSYASSSLSQLATGQNAPANTAAATNTSGSSSGLGWVSPQIVSTADSSVYQQAQSAGQMVPIGAAGRTTGGQVIQASHNQSVRVEEPRTSATASTRDGGSLSSRIEPARFVPPANAQALPAAIDIMDLPPARQSQRSSYRGDSSSIATQANYAVAEQQPSKIVTLTRGAATYGHHPDWHWLQGRLQQSASGRWVLDYQPPGEAADRFGGQVELAASELLQGFRPGDLVTVQGTLDSTPGRYDRLYVIERIELQQ